MCGTLSYVVHYGGSIRETITTKNRINRFNGALFASLNYILAGYIEISLGAKTPLTFSNFFLGSLQISQRIQRIQRYIGIVYTVYAITGENGRGTAKSLNYGRLEKKFDGSRYINWRWDQTMIEGRLC